MPEQVEKFDISQEHKTVCTLTGEIVKEFKSIAEWDNGYYNILYCPRCGHDVEMEYETPSPYFNSTHTILSDEEFIEWKLTHEV